VTKRAASHAARRRSTSLYWLVLCGVAVSCVFHAYDAGATTPAPHPPDPQAARHPICHAPKRIRRVYVAPSADTPLDEYQAAASAAQEIMQWLASACEPANETQVTARVKRVFGERATSISAIRFSKRDATRADVSLIDSEAAHADTPHIVGLLKLERTEQSWRLID
jgi:hypothetical protein